MASVVEAEVAASVGNVGWARRGAAQKEVEEKVEVGTVGVATVEVEQAVASLEMEGVTVVVKWAAGEACEARALAGLAPEVALLVAALAKVQVALVSSEVAMGGGVAKAAAGMVAAVMAEVALDAVIVEVAVKEAVRREAAVAAAVGSAARSRAAMGQAEGKAAWEVALKE